MIYDMIYMCYIDSSKAFDRVNFWCLFDKLIKRKVPVIFVRFFMVWYCTQEFVVRWGNHTIIRAAFFCLSVCLFVPYLLRGPLTDLRQTWWVYVGGPRNCP